MIHEFSVRFDDIWQSIIAGNVHSDGVVHVVRLTDNVKVVIRSIHSHVLLRLFDNVVTVVESTEDLVYLLGVGIGEHLRLLRNVCFDDSALLIKHFR